MTAARWPRLFWHTRQIPLFIESQHVKAHDEIEIDFSENPAICCFSPGVEPIDR